MTQKKYALLIALAMTVVAASLSGCGTSGSSTASSELGQAAKADVTVSAKFPVSGSAVKSLIPDKTAVIEVYAYQQSSQNYQQTLIATLTPAAPTQTVKMAPGLYTINAVAYDSSDTATRTQLARTSTAGEVQLGVANNVNLTFLDGQWTLVDANDAASPLVLSNGTQLNDFVIGSEMNQYPVAKSAIDYTKPVGGGSGIVRLRFNNNTSARTYGGMASQFVGTTSSNSLYSDSYNLTQKCGLYNYYALPCDEKAGNQLVMISGKGGGNYQSGSYYEGSFLYGSAETLLPGGGKTSFTLNGQAVDLEAQMPETTVTGGKLMTGGILEWLPSTDKTKTLALASAQTPPPDPPSTGSTGGTGINKIVGKAVKSQSNNTAYTALTVKEVQTLVCSGTNPKNRGTWSFANNTSAGKVVLSSTSGDRVCYTNYPYLSNYNPITYTMVADAGDYSYGLVPTDVNNIGDYCHEWDYNPNIYTATGMIPNPNYNTCKTKYPAKGDIYNPSNFRALKSSSKTAISYGSFKFNFWGESTQSGTAYLYPFRAKGSSTVAPAK
ncbi:MAG TPA: hypothetical protein HPP94_04895 [Desulfuromonadales bacterium]|nr:hypothetical protein [Desulfuromonadales bacterium]